jgi:hypothetical protein
LVSGQNAAPKPSREKRICEALGIDEIKYYAHHKTGRGDLGGQDRP